MDHLALVPVGTRRAAITGIELPSPPPTRVYISGHEFQLAAPRIPLPPILHVIKTVLNWSNLAGRIARNILHVKVPDPVVTSDHSVLLNLANFWMNMLTTTSGIQSNISSNWTLNNAVCSDMSGTTASATSTVAPLAGSNAAAPFPPQVTVCLSWQIAESYRGGKPRTYVPGIPQNATNTTGSSQLSTTYANALASVGDAILTAINARVETGAGAATDALGTVSYHTGHAVRPTPLFRAFLDCRVHERLDSQRRRSGAENLFPETP